MAVVRLMNPTLTNSLILMLDTETDGPDENEAAIVEVGGAFFLGGRRIGPPVNVRVNPGRPIPIEATRVHHITDDDVRDAPTFAELAPRFERLLSGSFIWGQCAEVMREYGFKGPTPPILGGYNAMKYDSVVLNRALEAAGSRWRIDAETMLDPIWAARWAWPHRSARLGNVLGAYNLPNASAHAAWADADATGRLLFAMVGDGLVSDDLVDAYAEQAHRMAVDQADRGRWGHYLYTGRDDGETLYVGFGRHRGTPLPEIDPGFVRWLRGLGDVPDHVMAKFEEAIR